MRWVLFGGEVMPPETIAALGAHMPNARFSNSYGPAEVNQCSFHHVDGVPGDGPLPIGVPMPDAELRVVDDTGEPCPAGQPGELLVRAATMMDRYWGRDDLTDRAFRFTELPGGGSARWYVTGDVVRQGPDGRFEFIGRVDNQVKVRGNRVELESVEAVLMAFPGVVHAVAGVVDFEGNQVLAAGVVAADGAEVDHDGALAAAAAQLPPYAVPFRLVTLDILPFTPSGKLDRLTVRDQLAELLATRSPHEERT